MVNKARTEVNYIVFIFCYFYFCLHYYFYSYLYIMFISISCLFSYLFCFCFTLLHSKHPPHIFSKKKVCYVLLCSPQTEITFPLQETATNPCEVSIIQSDCYPYDYCIAQNRTVYEINNGYQEELHNLHLLVHNLHLLVGTRFPNKSMKILCFIDN